MKIDRVTITGADDKTDIGDLIALHHLYPLVEFGILFSGARGGTQRYPLLSKAIEMGVRNIIPLSAHLCGAFAKQVLEKNDFSVIDNLIGYDRIQLNYNFGKSSEWSFLPVVKYAETHPERSIIIQWNKSNREWLFGEVEDGLPENIHFLYDSSGGRGVSITNIQDPLPNYTGYSGGLHPGNISECLKSIEENKIDRNVWVDMESGIRTENEFDLQKVTDVLAICDDFISPK